MTDYTATARRADATFRRNGQLLTLTLKQKGGYAGGAVIPAASIEKSSWGIETGVTTHDLGVDLMSTFALQIAAWVEKTKGSTDQVVRYALTEIDRRVMNRSPVGDAKYWLHKPPKGYVGGRFRGNWQLSMGAPATGITDAIDQDGKATLSAHASVIAVAAAGQTFYLMNNLPYAMPIERGWSRQAPVGVIALTVVEWNNIVDAAVNGVRSGTSASNFAQGYQTYGL